MSPLPSTDATRIGSPSLSLLCWEPLRAALEYTHLRCRARSIDRTQGDGHPVVIFPGLAADHRLTRPLQKFCAERGYTALDWGRGLNRGPGANVDSWLRQLADEIAALPGGNERISLIGWSLGGIYAREIARLMPDRIRQVITVGTPFSGGVEHTNVGLAYRLLNGRSASVDADLQARLRECPPVPTTSIYSRSDGVVAWRACLQAQGHERSENLEVSGSHCGLCWNASVLEIIANRLAQPDADWQPYRPLS